MDYSYYPWIENIEYPLSDFYSIYLIYGLAIGLSLYKWDRMMYERYLNE
jgi:hypothetical protein